MLMYLQPYVLHSSLVNSIHFITCKYLSSVEIVKTIRIIHFKIIIYAFQDGAPRW